MTLPPGAPLVVRHATSDDAAACAAVHHGSWVETYAALLPAAHWETDTVERRTEAWRHWLGPDAPAPVTVIVAEVAGEVVGLAVAGDAQQDGPHPPVRESHLYQLYVRAAHHGTGVGQALLDAAVAPGDPAQLWVAEENPRARRFYERNGFVPDGTRYLDEELGIVDVRYVR